MNPEKVFRLFDNESPVPVNRVSARKTAETLFSGHRPTATSIPNFPEVELLDLRLQVNHDAVDFRKSYVLHAGRQPVAMVSMFCPPHPSISPAITRGLMAASALTFEHTIVVEYITIDNQSGKDEVDHRRNQLKRMSKNFKGEQVNDVDTQMVDDELVGVRREIQTPSNGLIRARFYVLVYGPQVVTETESEKEFARALHHSLAELERRCELIEKILRGIEGVDAEREYEPFLKNLYQQTLICEADAHDTGRELSEVTNSLACLVPTEDSWRGSDNPHFIFGTASGRLLPFNLFDYTIAPEPVVLFLASPGAGKTFLMISLVLSYLANASRGRVCGIDFGNGLGPLAAMLGGFRVRFDPDDPKPLNIFDYPELAPEEGAQAPDEAQIELVVSFYLHLAGIDKTHPKYHSYRSVLSIVVQAIYERCVARIQRMGVKEEPTLLDLLGDLSDYPFSGSQKTDALDLKGLLTPYSNNPWLSQPTDPSYQESRLTVFEWDSLDRFQETNQFALSYASAARVVRSIGKRNADGTRDSQIIFIEEMWKIRLNFPHVERVINKGARQGRAAGIKLFLLSHALDDFSSMPGVMAGVGTILCGLHKDQAKVPLYKTAFEFSDEACAAVRAITNHPGQCHQFLMALGSGQNRVFELVEHRTSPVGLWYATTQKIEADARERVQFLKPDWSEDQIIMWLARHYPQGLVMAGLNSIDESLLTESHR